MVSEELRRSQIETVVDCAATAARKVPFSEKKRDLTGPDMAKSAAGEPVLTSKILIWLSDPPAAMRWPSGWNWTDSKADKVWLALFLISNECKMGSASTHLHQ